jgi:drug/metabolite transporter (DMT)-like permease
VLNSLAIIWTALFSRLLLKNRFNWGQYIGIAILMVGSVVYASGSSGSGGDDV